MSSHKRNKIHKTENIIVMSSQNNYVAYDYWHQPTSKKGVEYCANNKHKCETKSNIWKTMSCSRKSWKRQFSCNACICPNIRTKKTLKTQNLANIYLFKVNIKNTRKWCKICSMFNVQNDVTTSFCVFIVNFEHSLHIFLVVLLLKKQSCKLKTTDKVKIKFQKYSENFVFQLFIILQ